MGFDLYGVNPKINTAKPEVLTEYRTDEGWTDFVKLEEQGLKNNYFKENDKWEDDNPGSYFRNNVWWWRPLWDFICGYCDEILTEEDAEQGHSNSGHIIDEEKALAIARILENLIDDGEVEDYAKERQAMLDAEPDEECTYCEGTGRRKVGEGTTKGPRTNKCNVCDGKGSSRPFNSMYPFSKDNVKEFAEFAAQSGGFEIC